VPAQDPAFEFEIRRTRAWCGRRAADPGCVNTQSSLTSMAGDISSAEPAAGHGPANLREPARVLRIVLFPLDWQRALRIGCWELRASALDPLTVSAALPVPLLLSRLLWTAPRARFSNLPFLGCHLLLVD